jgi:hypothetical protein
LEKKYLGKCRITQCPANYAKHSSGCIFNKIDKNKINVPDLAYIYNLDMAEADKMVARGTKKIKNIVCFVEYLNFIRDKNYPNEIGSSVLLHIERFPFNIKELNICNEMFWKIIFYSEHCEISLSDFLKIRKNEWRRLKRISKGIENDYECEFT